MNQPLSYVHPDAIIAKNVVIEPFTTIDKNVKIGHNKWDYSYAFENFNIAAVPLYSWSYEKALIRSKTDNFIGDEEGFLNAAAAFG